MTEKELIIYIVPTSLKNLVNSKDWEVTNE